MKIKHILLAALTVLAACAPDPQPVKPDYVAYVKDIIPLEEPHYKDESSGRTQAWPCPDWQTWRLQATSENTTIQYYPYRRKVAYAVSPYLPHRPDGGNQPVIFTFRITNLGNVPIEYLNGANYVAVPIGQSKTFTNSSFNWYTDCGLPAPTFSASILVRMTSCPAPTSETNFTWSFELAGVSSGSLYDGSSASNRFTAISIFNPGVCSIPY